MPISPERSERASWAGEGGRGGGSSLDGSAGGLDFDGGPKGCVVIFWVLARSVCHRSRWRGGGR